MTDFLLVAWVSALIEMRRFAWMFGLGRRWSSGEKLRLLFAGYNGTRNTGSDVRVQEMLRQVRHVLGAVNVDFSVMTQSFDRSKGYFEGTRQVYLPDVFPPFLSREVKQNHGVIACEGSMFKSKFANALTTMMIGSLGLASSENKVSLAYGGEAGHMDPLIQSMCERYVHDSLVITRNVESQNLLRKLGIPTELGTDTAWTFEPHPPEYARKTLRAAGWDEKTPILILCPIHPFVWPLKASLVKYIARVTTGAYKESQYRTVYFHESGAEVDRISVPGSLEIPGAIAIAIDAARARRRPYDGAVALGCVIRGDTIHFEIVSHQSARGLMELSIAKTFPIGNGIITVDTEAQAWARARVAEQNKGGDAARAALALIGIKERLGKR